MGFNLLKVGDKAPSFSLLNYDGKEVSLSDFRGKNIIIWFFPKASTPGWTVEGCGFRDEYQKFKDKNIEIIGCSADSVIKQDKFCAKQKFQFTMLCDEEHTMLESYKVWGKKKFMGREYMGISRATYLIDEKGFIEKVYSKVKPLSHAKDILKEL